MRTTVPQCVKRSMDVEDAYRAPVNQYDFAFPWRQFRHVPNDVASHRYSPYNSRAFSSKMRWCIASGSFGKAWLGESKSQWG